MADREVKVKLTGSETVSDAAKKAEGGLSGLAIAVAKGQAIYEGAKRVISEVSGFIRDAGEEAIRAEQTTAQLNRVLISTGSSYAALRDTIEAQVESLVKLGFADDDVRESLSKMVQQSGNAQGSLNNLGVVADLARAKNISLADAGELVGKAMAGNTTQLTRMFPALKGSTDAIADLGLMLKGTAETHAATFGGALERVAVQFSEVKEAIGVALLGTSEMGTAATGLASILGNLAQWIERNEDRIHVFTSALASGGRAVFEIARAIWNVLGPPLTWLAKVAFVAVIGGLEALSASLRIAAGGFQSFAGHALDAIGTLVEKGGRFLKVFGIDVVEGAGKSMREFGELLVSNASAAVSRAQSDFQSGMTRLKSLREGFHRDEAAGEVTHQNNLTAAVRFGTRQREDIVKATKTVLVQASVEVRDSIEQQDTSWKGLEISAKKFEEVLKRLPPAVKPVTEDVEATGKSVEDTVRGAMDLGRALLDVGQASGLVDAKMAGVLNSVMNIGASLAKIGVDPLGGMVGIISGLANVITGIGNSEAHKRFVAAMAQNRLAVERLTREVGNLNLGATGRTFQGVTSAINATSAANAAGQFGTGPQGDIKAFMFFARELAKAGVSMEDAKELFKDLGFGDLNAATFRPSLGTISKGLDETEFGQFGDDFESSLESVQTGWDIFGIEDDAAKLGGLAGIAKRFAPAIHRALMGPNPGEALRDLFTQLQSGGLNASDFGDLTGRQFLDLLKLLIPLVDAVGFVPGSVASQGATGPKAKTGGLDPATEPGGLGIDGSVGVGAVGVVGVGGSAIGSGSAGGGVTITGNTFQFGPVTVDPAGQSLEDAGSDLAGYVAEQLARRLRDQAAAAGVPI